MALTTPSPTMESTTKTFFLRVTEKHDLTQSAAEFYGVDELCADLSHDVDCKITECDALKSLVIKDDASYAIVHRDSVVEREERSAAKSKQHLTWSAIAKQAQPTRAAKATAEAVKAQEAKSQDVLTKAAHALTEYARDCTVEKRTEAMPPPFAHSKHHLTWSAIAREAREARAAKAEEIKAQEAAVQKAEVGRNSGGGRLVSLDVLEGVSYCHYTNADAEQSTGGYAPQPTLAMPRKKREDDATRAKLEEQSESDSEDEDVDHDKPFTLPVSAEPLEIEVMLGYGC